MDIFDKAAEAADAGLAMQKIKEMERAKAKEVQQAQEEQAREQENARRAFPENPMNGAR